jgi:hypothetical protein
MISGGVGDVACSHCPSICLSAVRAPLESVSNARVCASDIPLAVAERVAAEDVDPSMPKVVIGDSSCIPIQVAVPVEQ